MAPEETSPTGDWAEDQTLAIKATDLHGGGQTETASWAKLIVREPGLEPVSVRLTGETVVLGRGPESDARLHSPYVSRRHLAVVRDGDGHALQCFDSPNETRLNGRPVQGEVRLAHGDEVQVADVSIWYVIEVPVDAKTPTFEPPERAPASSSVLYLSLDEERHRVWLAERNEEAQLAPNEYKLLSHLMQRPGHVATREELLRAVWGESEYDLDSLYRLVQRLKEKIEVDPAKPKYLVSHRGLGYSLEADSGSAEDAS